MNAPGWLLGMILLWIPAPDTRVRADSIPALDTLAVMGISPAIQTQHFYDSLAVLAAERRRAQRPEVVRLLREAQRLEVFRVSSHPTANGSSKRAIQGYPILSIARDPGLFRDSLIALVERETTFDNGRHDGQLACLFSPGFGVRATDHADTLEGLVCFTCRQWYLKGPRVEGIGGTFDREVVAMKALFDGAFAQGERRRKPQ